MTHGQSTGQVDGDVPEPDARLALAGKANPADALPVFDHGIIMNTDRTQLQHLPVPEMHNAATCQIFLASRQPLKLGAKVEFKAV